VGEEVDENRKKSLKKIDLFLNDYKKKGTCDR
jgi:hypothetical protein